MGRRRCDEDGRLGGSVGLQPLSPLPSKATRVPGAPGLSVQDTSRAPSGPSTAQLESVALTWGKHRPALARLQGPNISIMRTRSGPAHSSL